MGRIATRILDGLRDALDAAFRRLNNLPEGGLHLNPRRLLPCEHCGAPLLAQNDDLPGGCPCITEVPTHAVTRCLICGVPTTDGVLLCRRDACAVEAERMTA